ncbi:hypothetical protein F2P56_010635 [Juglans regia]|uniref:IQ domain-containing protein IQM3-like n=1 Tax=Juglans regia TaxID=51240 RepID=A0A833XRM6_JUGRE|nr:hypothetical protein F2P56_010635 [Juglans regia]
MMVHKHTGNLLHTNQGLQGSKWIFVMSTLRKLYGGEKKKGLFHHSSFLAGGATLAAGRLEAEHGKLKSVSAYSGHYRPTDENLGSFLAFLKENGISLDEVQVLSPVEDHESYDIGTSVQEGSELERRSSYKRTLSSNLQSSKRSVPKKEILQRIKSKKEACSYQLGHQLSLKWSTGAGPRIGCVADYPLELRLQSLKFVNLSSGDPHTASASTLPSNLTSITSFCVVM